MAENIERTLKPVNVTPDQPTAEDTTEKSPYSDEQLVIARKIRDAAIEAGIDPKYALSIAHIENNFNTGPSPTGAAGPMQLTRGTADYLGVDRDNIDENIKGGVAYLKEQLNKYGDPYMAGIAYNGGPGMADEFIKTGDSKALSNEAYDYYYKLRDTYKAPADVDQEEPTMKIEAPASTEIRAGDKYKEGVDKAAAVGVALPAAAYAGHKIKKSIEAANIADEAALSKAESKLSTKEGVVRGKESTLAGKQEQLKGRVLNQTSLAEDAQKNAERLRDAQLAAEKRLAKATDNARRYGVLEEVVKTTPGGVTQQGGLGSGAMRHANVMGEVHEANVVRKGTETAGPGYSQKSRLIVPDKYAGASVYNPEQIAAQKELAAAEAEHQRLIKAADKAEGAAQGAANKLRDITEKGPSGLTAAEQQLKHAKDEYERVKNSMPSTSKVVKLARAASKVPFTFVAPAAFGAMDAVETANRLKRGEYGGAAISGVGALGGALSMVPPIGPLGAAARLSGLGLSLAAPVAQYVYDKYNAPTEPAKFGVGGSVAAILAKKAAAKKAADAAAKKSATVMRPKRVAYPGIYDDPKKLVAEATSRVEEESPLLKRLFGVTRDDLFNITEQGRRKGNITERPFKAAPNATGAAHAEEVMNPRNVQRIQDIIGESKSSPELYKGMASWYTMDPLFNRYVELYGLENAIKEYNRFNTLTGMASPGSEVLTELNRGSAANWLDAENRFSDFVKYGGKTGTGPADMRNVLGHPYHSTAHGLPMSKYLESGVLDMGSAKVPSYITASGVPETGFQTSWPVGDAHWSRLVGLPDVRGARTKKGVEVLPNASASVPEMVSLGPWWEQKIAKPMELESVPAQAVVWGSGSGATGVTSPIGSPKLELISKLIGDTANRLGVSPETARDLVILRKTHLAEGGIVKGYAKGGSEGTDIDELAEYYGSRLDSSNSDMRPPVISDKGNVVRNMVAQRNALADKYLGGAGRPISKGLSTARQFLNDEVYTHTSPGNRFGDWTIGQMPEAIYDYTTAGMPGPVLGNEWVPNTAAGGMMHTDPYGDIRGLDLLNVIGAEVPFVAAGKAAYKVAKPLARAAAENTIGGINRANRALRTPEPLMMNVETSTANRSDDAAETLRRFKEVAAQAKFGRRDLGPAMQSEYPIGQGVWTGEKGAAQFHPNVMANIKDFSPEEINRMRQLLDQYGIGAGRFRPDLIAQPSRANAVQILDADPEWIKNIGQHYAQSNLPAVVFAQPNNRAMVFNMNSDLPKDLSVLLDAPQLAGKKVRYGEANIPTDRNYINSVESARVTGTKKAPKKKAK